MASKASIVIPVFNRTNDLRRALTSLTEQTLPDFECYVVDDASTVNIAAIVGEFDDRFVYVRSSVNVGPSGARLMGFELISGDFLLLLDSDNELFPWGLERAMHYLEANSSVSGVTGHYVYPDGLRVRVGDGERIITPAEYARTGSSHYDMVGAIRTEVVSEWLRKERRYYAAEFHLWLTYHMKHDHLAVDEPWGKYNEGVGPRVSQSRDERNYRDVQLFVEEHRRPFATTPCSPLDEYLGGQWVSLRRAGRPEASLLKEWMGVRGLTRFGALVPRVRRRFSAHSTRCDVL